MIEVVWDWPWQGALVVEHDEAFCVRIHEYCTKHFPHYDSGPPHNDATSADEWAIFVDALSKPEKTQVWDWIEQQDNVNQGEA